MNRYLFIALFVHVMMTGANRLFAQDNPTHLFRGYWDNDFFNIRGRGTDEAYTNGFRFDLFHLQKPKAKKFIIDRFLFPKAGDSSVNVRGWGFGQMMMTPRDLNKTDYQPGDYPYAGALVGIHSLYSYNPKKKYSLQTELMAGVRGPEAFAAQTQTFIHKLIGNSPPRGWNNQLGTKMILNANFTVEKQLTHYRNVGEMIVGGQAFAGTLFNFASAYATFRIGKMTPYFNGYLSQHSSIGSSTSQRRNRLQAYLIIRPSAGFTINNDMLTKETHTPTDAHGSVQSSPPIEHWNLSIDYGAVITSGHVGFSFIQKSMSAMLKGLPRHEVGNVSLYYTW